MFQLEKFAQDFVDSTTQFVGNRIINIMNTDAIIIASTERHRIGTFHAGAALAVKTGKAVSIQHDEIVNYPGAKEGWNIPIWDDGAIAGVVGVFGKPEEVNELANLLGAYVCRYFELQNYLQRQHIERDIRQQILQSLILEKNTADQDKMLRQLSLIGMEFSLPAVVILFPLYQENTASIKDIKKCEYLESCLVFSNLVNKRSDLFGQVSGNYVIIRHIEQPEPFREKYLFQLKKVIDEKAGDSAGRITVGSIAEKMEGIPVSYREAVTMQKFDLPALADIFESRVRRSCFVFELAETSGRNYCQRLERLALGAFPQKELQTLLFTVLAYFDSERSVYKSAQMAGIHKNTLLYRLKNVYKALELENCGLFEKELAVRMLCMRLYKTNRIPAAFSDDQSCANGCFGM